MRCRQRRGGRIRRQLGIASLLSASALAWVVAGAAAISVAPTATTGPVSAVGPTSATVTGTVNPGGQATTWFVEYGTSTSYGSQTSSTNVGTGTANVAVSRALSGLTAGTTYHYRVVATNGAGTSRGADGIFTTLAAPAAVTGSATGVTTDLGDAEWHGRPERPRDGLVLRVRHEHELRLEDAGHGTPARAAAPSRPPSASRASRVAGSTTTGSSRRATRARAAAPTRPSRPSASPRSRPTRPARSTPTAARLNGRLTPNGQATSWYFEYGTTQSYGLRTPTRNAGSGTNAARVSFSLTGLRPATTYHYRLVATNASGHDRRHRPRVHHAAAACRPHGCGAECRHDDRDPDRHDRPAWTGDDLVVRVRNDDALRLAYALAQRRLRRRDAHGHGGGERPRRREDVPLPARRPQRRRDDLRCRRHSRNRRRHPGSACTPRRLRARDHALRGRADEASRRGRDAASRSSSARARSARSPPSSPPPTAAGATSRSPASGRRTQRAGTAARVREQSSPSGPRSRSVGPRPASSRHGSPARGRSPGGSSSCSGARRAAAG